jgi:3-deoxy-D-manno-octulosonic acid kinase
MRDLYFGPGRALREIIGSQALHTKGIPTPEILAVLFYPAGLFVRIDVVTSAVPDSQDFVSFLFSRPARSEKKGALTAVRGLLAKLRQHGVVHPDLNARNILLARRSGSPLRAWILDVDAIRWESANSKDVDTANRNRLLRSLFKRARLGDLGMDESSVKFLWRELFPTR